MGSRYDPLVAFALVGVVLGMMPFLVVPALRARVKPAHDVFL